MTDRDALKTCRYCSRTYEAGTRCVCSRFMRVGPTPKRPESPDDNPPREGTDDPTRSRPAPSKVEVGTRLKIGNLVLL